MSDSVLARRPALDGLRGVAVLAVLAYHLALPGTAGGFIGVDIFFVLSGFLIGSLLDGERSTRGKIDLPRFWARRARRLLPALIVVATAVALWTRASGDWASWPLRRDDLIGTLGYIANWHFIAAGTDYFAATSGASPLLHTWSLAIEEQFYAFWPLLFVGAVALGFAFRRRLALSSTPRASDPTTVGPDMPPSRRLHPDWTPGRIAAVLVAVGLAIASAIAAAALFDPADPSRAYYGTDTRIHQILVGVVLGLLVRPWRTYAPLAPGPRRIISAIQLPLLAGLLLGIVFADPVSPVYYAGGSVALALLVAALIFAVERVPDGLVARLLSTRPLVAMGTISYGLYLWHWPVIVATAPADPAGDTFGLLLLRLALSIGLAAVMFVLIERPIREGRLPVVRRSSWRSLVAGGLVLVMTAGFSLGMTDLNSVAAIDGASSDPVSASVTSGDEALLSEATDGAPSDGRTAASASAAASPLKPRGTPAAAGASGAATQAPATSSPRATPGPEVVKHGAAEVAAAAADFAHWQCPTNNDICTKVQGPRGALTVVLFGDSSIGSLDVGMTEWAQKADVTYVLAASGGCSASGQPRSDSPTQVKKGAMDAKCEGRYEGIVEQVAALPGPLLVLVSAVSENRTVVLPDGSTAPFGTDAQRNAVTGGIERLVKSLRRDDVTVVLMGPAPHTLKPQCAGPGDGACAMAPLEADWAAQEQVASWYADVAAKYPDLVRYVRLDDIVCPGGGPCSSWQADTLIRWDGIHYTRPGSRLVTAEIMRRLEADGVPTS
jgi:peptidoglycan/LPS O-acetylase OafA/YrhL